MCWVSLSSICAQREGLPGHGSGAGGWGAGGGWEILGRALGAWMAEEKGQWIKWGDQLNKEKGLTSSDGKGK